MITLDIYCYLAKQKFKNQEVLRFLISKVKKYVLRLAVLATLYGE